MKKVVGYNLKKSKSESTFYGSSMGLLHLERQSSWMPELTHLHGTFVGEVEPWARVWRLGPRYDPGQVISPWASVPTYANW